MDVVEDVDVPGTYPQWNGEDPAISGLPAGEAWSCPASSYSVMVLGTREHGTFIIAGLFKRLWEHGARRNGFPTARYQVPDAQHPNTSANYYIYGGQVDVECQGGYLQRGIIKQWVGNLHPYQYHGSAGPSNRRASTASQGWAFQNASNFKNGSANGDWAKVLRTYVEQGICTPGWAIIIDGKKVCNGKDG
jgi:hypothetical protein